MYAENQWLKKPCISEMLAHPRPPRHMLMFCEIYACSKIYSFSALGVCFDIKIYCVIVNDNQHVSENHSVKNLLLFLIG